MYMLTMISIRLTEVFNVQFIMASTAYPRDPFSPLDKDSVVMFASLVGV